MDQMAWARERIAAQRGRLHGWRPITRGDLSVIAVEVLGVARHAEDLIGLRVIVAGKTAAAIDALGPEEAERMLRARSILAPEDEFALVHTGELQESDDASEDPLRWPWVALVVHAPIRQLPAIAGLATDTVPSPQ